MINDELRGYFTEDEFNQLPLTMKTAMKQKKVELSDERNTSFVRSKIHNTSKYSSYSVYKPVSSFFYE